MEKTAERKRNISENFLRFSLLSVILLFISLLFISFQGLGFSSFFATISTLIVSIVFTFIFSKKKVATVENPTEDGVLMCGNPKSVLEKEVDEQKPNPESVTAAFFSTEELSEVNDVHEYQVESTDFPSGSESSDELSASENIELNWMCFNNVRKNVEMSEDSVSSSDYDEDEDDNLIEISFPDNNSSELNEVLEEKLQTGLPEYFPESIFRQESLMELLAEINEVNEEDSLIEIDLSMGSIKASGLEVEA